jgi:hypothetical protein
MPLSFSIGPTSNASGRKNDKEFSSAPELYAQPVSADPMKAHKKVAFMLVPKSLEREKQMKTRISSGAWMMPRTLCGEIG